jgi:LytR cell envelope-related transcriptional attenuator
MGGRQHRRAIRQRGCNVQLLAFVPKIQGFVLWATAHFVESSDWDRSPGTLRRRNVTVPSNSANTLGTSAIPAVAPVSLNGTNRLTYHPQSPPPSEESTGTMATSAARRPLPALAFLLALSLLTALVWWRVLHRSDSAKASSPSSSCSASPTPSVTAVPAPAAVTVNVLNSTTKTGLAAQVTALLAAAGFKTGTPSNDSSTRAPVATVAEIRYGPKGASGAKLVSFYVPGSVLVLDTRTDATVDLALGAKYTAVLAPTDVAKALASAKVSQLPAPAAASGATSVKPSSTPPASSASKSSASSSASSTKSC